MINEKQIKEWLDSGTITKDQADKMLADVQHKSKEEKSNKFIVAISTLGAILLGIGAILFIASNWTVIPNLLKVLILLGSTFSSYYIGYLFKYQKKNLPKVGAVLIFLGSLLFGASVILIAQIYNINANAHSLVLIWLIGILPLVYGFESKPIAALSSILYYLWIALFIFRNGFFDDDIIILFPIIFMSASALLFSIGGLHYFKPLLEKVAKIFRIFGIKIAMFCVFILTFTFFSGSEGLHMEMLQDIQLTTSIVLFSILAIIGLIINIFFNPSKSKTNLLENGVALGLVAFTLLFFFFPSNTDIYTIIYNLIFVGLTILLIYIGYQKHNIQVVNIGIFWISVFIFARYFDFLWDLMPRSLFFMIGGLILVLGGIAMERKRKLIKEEFKKTNT